VEPGLSPDPADLGGCRLHRQAKRLGAQLEDGHLHYGRRNPHAFGVLLRRWVVERTFAWISKAPRTTCDYERLPASHEAMVLWAMIALMTPPPGPAHG
jgi:transposase